jgi:hypothetical protein
MRLIEHGEADGKQFVGRKRRSIPTVFKVLLKRALTSVSAEASAPR